MHQASPFTTYGFGDEKMGRIGMGEGRRVELHELHIDHPRSSTIGNGDPIATCTPRIRRTQKNLPQSSSRQNSVAGYAALHLPAGLLIQICAHTGQWS